MAQVIVFLLINDTYHNITILLPFLRLKQFENNLSRVGIRLEILHSAVVSKCCSCRVLINCALKMLAKVIWLGESTCF